jgi:ABC-type transport system substrate-binding protein
MASLGHLGHLTLRDADLTFELYEPSPNLPLILAQTEHLIRPEDKARRASGVRSGLYRLRVQEPGRHLIAERVPRHWKENEAGWFDEIELVKFSDAAVRMQALREGIVDLADATNLEVDADPREFTLLPDALRPTQIVSKSIALPTRIGTALPFDNMRMAERWWIA